MNQTAWPGSYKAAASLTFDFDAETVWVALDPANAHRPGVLSIGAYMADRLRLVGAMKAVDGGA
jgi:hypothetical protein